MTIWGLREVESDGLVLPYERYNQTNYGNHNSTPENPLRDSKHCWLVRRVSVHSPPDVDSRRMTDDEVDSPAN